MELAKQDIDQLITFGENSIYINEIYESNKKDGYSIHYNDMDKLIKELNKFINKNDIVLIKGSRGMKMERVFNVLSEVDDE